jgi:hypothetical protein
MTTAAAWSAEELEGRALLEQGMAVAIEVIICSPS